MELYQAIKQGDKDTVIELLKKGADVNACGDYGRTPLMMAVVSKHADTDMMKILIQHGADVFAQMPKSKCSALLLAASDAEKFWFLEKYGEAFPANTKLRVMPFTCDAEVREYLFENGFSPIVQAPCDYLESSVEDTRLEAYSRQCMWEEVRYYASKDVSLESLQWNSLMRQIILGDVKSVANELTPFCDLTEQDHHFRTPLHLAICTGDVEKAKVLQAAGALLIDEWDARRTLLGCAVLSNSVHMLYWLNDNGFDITQQDPHGYSALELAMEFGLSQLVPALLKLGCDPLAESEYGQQAINHARDAAAVRQLADAGANLDHIDQTGSYALKVAAANDDVAFAQALLERGAKVNNESLGFTALHQATINDHVNVMRVLLDHGADPNAFEDGGTVLSLVQSRVGACMLLAAGADPTCVTDDNRSAAELHGERDFVDVFL